MQNFLDVWFTVFVRAVEGGALRQEKSMSSEPSRDTEGQIWRKGGEKTWKLKFVLDLKLPCLSKKRKTVFDTDMNYLILLET